MTAPGPRSAGNTPAFTLLPGIALTAAVALGASLVRQLAFPSGFSALIVALGLSLVLRNTVGLPAACRTGVAFSLRRVLRFAVVLLGLQLSLRQVIDVGGLGLLIVGLTLGGSYLFTLCAGIWLRVDRGLCHLIAAGTSICGASAVLAANAVTRGSDEDGAYAVAVVTLFGTLSMLAYPWLPGVLTLSEPAYGLWAGASIHEVAQVVAAAFQNGPVSGELGTVSKLSRVLLLAPVVALLGLVTARETGLRERLKPRSWPVPGFVLGFAAMCLLNTLAPLPAGVKGWVGTGNQFLLAMALAALGLETDVRKLAGKGPRPLLLGAASWLFITGLSYLLIRAFAY
jgi:uncharacterized integral membrane protein (TIGR00698 family)